MCLLPPWYVVGMSVLHLLWCLPGNEAEARVHALSAAHQDAVAGSACIRRKEAYAYVVKDKLYTVSPHNFESLFFAQDARPLKR